MGRDGLHDVVMDEEPEPDGDAGAGRRGRQRGGDRAGPAASAQVVDGRIAPRYRRRRTPLAAAALVAVLLAVIAVVDAVQERERVARVLALPRVLDPLDGPVTEAWSIPGGWEHTLDAGTDLTVAVFATGDGSELVASDFDTGAELWRAALPRLRGRPVDNVVCRPLVRQRRTTHLACRFLVPLPPGVERASHGPGAEARLVVLDAGTGEKVDERTLGVGFGAMETAGRDVVLVEVLADGQFVLTREDPVVGEKHWTFRGDVPMPSIGLAAGPLPRPFVAVQHDVITVMGPVSWALSADGRELGRWGPVLGLGGGFIEIMVLADGRFAVAQASSTPEPERRADVRVVVPGAGEAFSVDGPVLRLLVDDRTAPDVLLTASRETARIHAVDSATGKFRWAADHDFSSDVLVVDRRVLHVGRGAVVALDAGTGSVLWTALDGQMREYQQLLTDGDVLLVPTGPDGRPTTFHALDLDDGRTRWTADGPSDVVGFFAFGGRLVALQQEATVLMR